MSEHKKTYLEVMKEYHGKDSMYVKFIEWLSRKEKKLKGGKKNVTKKK